ncbi:MAG: DNA helicase II, partial [Acetobacteraceae bacterium]|nr:DNA helicase II [Acetobacteraceae bacterium]
YANWQSSIPSRFLDELPDAHVVRKGSAAMERERRLTAAPVFSSAFPVSARRPRISEAWEQPARPERAEKIPVGARVFHQKFGAGTVTRVDDDKLDIAFDHAGDKRVLDRFVERA